MKQELSKNEKLDQLGCKLLETSSLSQDELERIVSAPHIFAGIRQRIEAEKNSAEQQTPRRSIFSFYSFRGPAAAFAALLIIAFVVTAAIFIRSSRPENIVAIKQAGNEKVEPIAATGPTEIALPSNMGDDSGDLPKASVPIPREIAKTRTEPKASFAVVKKAVHQERDTDNDPDNEFYPVTSAGNGEEIADGGQVVRVDLPRSSLIAMGVNVPAEGADTVKTDLLISSDGVTRGFRIVKK